MKQIVFYRWKNKLIFWVGLLLWMLIYVTGVRREEAILMKSDELRMFPNVDNFQSLSVIVKTERGKLIVVDGGWENDSEKLVQIIKANGGCVSAWFLTHPHSDHAGALYKILRNGGMGISIEKIYCSLANPEWYKENGMGDPGIAEELMNEFQKLPKEAVENEIGKGTEVFVDDIRIVVMNERSEYLTDSVNNSCIVYKMWIKGKSILFLGDLAYKAGMQLLHNTCADDLKSDIVQMAHHGQNGVGKDVYEAISPKICLWPTPQWLWDNDNGAGVDSGPWHTLETRTWMEEIGNQKNLCTKDGEIHLYFGKEVDIKITKK